MASSPASDAPASDVRASDVRASDIQALSYEQARDELIRVVSELEQGSATLEQSLGLWERGEALAARCEQWLLGARERLEAARQSSQSSAGAE